MQIKGKRIRNAQKYLLDIDEGSLFKIGNVISESMLPIIKEKFGAESVNIGDRFFPSPLIGTMAKRNSVGEWIPQKDKPKETAYRAQEWNLQDWGGNSHSGTGYVPYKRFPRKFIEPKELELSISQVQNGPSIITVDKTFYNSPENYSEIVFAINLLLEIFGQAETFKVTEDNMLKTLNSIETVNWEILPKGERIWEGFNNQIFSNFSPSERCLIKERFEYIDSFEPDSVKKGIGGYTGYLVFEFKDKNLYILDSILYGEATYLFEDDWEHVSKLTKKEIIHNQLSKDRIVHNKQWKRKIQKYLT